MEDPIEHQIEIYTFFSKGLYYYFCLVLIQIMFLAGLEFCYLGCLCFFNMLKLLIIVTS